MTTINQVLHRALILLSALLVVATVSTCATLSPVAFAYEPSDFDRQAAMGNTYPTQPTCGEREAMRAERDFQQAQRNNQSLDALHNATPPFNPQAYNAPAPYNLYQNGRVQVCRRGANGAVYCQ